MAQDLETLFARAKLAILRSNQLAEDFVAAHKRMRDQITARLMKDFTPADRKIRYPQDISQKRPAYQPFPTETDDNET